MPDFRVAKRGEFDARYSQEGSNAHSAVGGGHGSGWRSAEAKGMQYR
jgi:hypothetical protein